MITLKPQISIGSLFAGIGGFDLGFTRAGFDIAWQVEIDPFCCHVLEKHWPDVARYGDVKAVHAHDSCPMEGCNECLAPVDVLCAGFPCQPVCHHGKRHGRNDSRWLWPEVYRLVGEMEPGYLVLENVSGLLSPGRGFSEILSGLAALGFDAEWECIPATAVGAPHYRERVWLVAYRTDNGRRAEPASRVYIRRPRRYDTNGCRAYPPRRNAGPEIWQAFRDADGPEPGILRKAFRISGGLDRLHALGNAVVPDIAQWIAESIVDAESQVERIRKTKREDI